MNEIAPLFVFGTRPEAIKMAPLVFECARRGQQLRPTICVTGQHREMLADMMAYFGMVADIDLAVMEAGQSPSQLTARLLPALDRVLARISPDCVVVQGDTTTVLSASLAAFYRRVPLVHVEAGLRTGNLQAPWPEELNRKVASLTAAIHCAPTPRAAETLANEGVPRERIHITGNTVIDSLLYTVARERTNRSAWQAKYSYLADHPLVLVTGHRRESFGQGLQNVCRAIVRLADQFSQVQFVYPVHLNPQVQQPVREALSGRENIHLTSPAPYGEFVWLMDRSTLLLTDSGGIQEEAPSLGKRVLVTREATERPEAVDCGLAELVGTNEDAIVDRARLVLSADHDLKHRPFTANPFGDGHAAERIIDLISRQAWTT